MSVDVQVQWSEEAVLFELGCSHSPEASCHCSHGYVGDFRVLTSNMLLKLHLA